MFMYSFCYVCSVLCILFRYVVLCIVCVQMCTVLLPPGVNPIAVNKYINQYQSLYSYYIILHVYICIPSANFLTICNIRWTRGPNLYHHEHGQNIWPKHLVFAYDESKNAVQLVCGEICAVLNILMSPSLETERNCKSFDTWQSNDRIATARLLINSPTE